MAKLHFSLEGNSLGEFALDKERMTIGRRPSNDIHIDNLAVSGEHAVITTIGNDSFLEDMGSTNGTLVNNKPIKKHVLFNNDVIEFGKYQLVYINPSHTKPAADPSSFENTVVMRPSKLDITTPDAEESVEEKPIETNNENAEPVKVKQTSADSTENAEKIAHLRMLNGTNSGRELTLNKALTTLGKPGIQVAVITKRPHGYFVTHVEGEKALLVNGQKIGTQAYALSDHDEIDLAGLKMKFYLS